MLRMVMLCIAGVAAASGSVLVSSVSPALAQVAPVDNPVFSAKLTNGVQPLGSALYTEQAGPDVVHQTLKVEVLGQPVNASLKILINGAVVGALQTDARGSGATGIVSDRPRTGGGSGLPTVRPGAVLVVGTVKGTFR